MKNKIYVIILLVLLSTLLIGTDAAPLQKYFENQDTDELSLEEIRKGLYYTMVDEKGREIMVTARKIHVGDEYITGDNELYRTYSIEGYKARCRFIRRLGSRYEEGKQGGILAALGRYFLAAEKEDGGKNNGQNLSTRKKPKGLIGVYHTHNAESYVPTDGTESIEGEGGIHDVGDSFTAALRKKDIKVLHDTTLHLPHDRGAYRRSRATAQKLLAKGPDAVFDIHRDAGPANYYTVKIGDEWLTQVQFVVGRQNPNMKTVRQYALDLKNAADQIHPGLVKGIFLAHGNYNQDLAPTNLLIEVGTHMNSKEVARNGAAMFADVVAYYFFGPDKQAAPAPDRQTAVKEKGGSVVNLPAVRNTFWTLAVTAAAGVIFYFINTPVGKVREKLLPYAEKTLPYTEKADSFLDNVQSIISAAYRHLAERIAAELRQGDIALERAADFIRDKTMQLINLIKTRIRQ